MSHVQLNNNTHCTDTWLDIFHPICTKSTMSKSIVQNLKPSKTSMKILLSDICPWHKLFQLITVAVLNANNFTCPFAIPTVSYCILSFWYFEAHFLMQTSTFPPWSMWCWTWQQRLVRKQRVCIGASLLFWILMWVQHHWSNHAVLGSLHNLIVTKQTASMLTMWTLSLWYLSKVMVCSKRPWISWLYFFYCWSNVFFAITPLTCHFIQFRSMHTHWKMTCGNLSWRSWKRA